MSHFDPPEEYDPQTDEALDFARGGMSLDEHNAREEKRHRGMLMAKDARKFNIAIKGPMGEYWRDYYAILDAAARECLLPDISISTLNDGAEGKFIVRVPNESVENVREFLRDGVRGKVFNQIDVVEA